MVSHGKSDMARGGIWFWVIRSLLCLLLAGCGERMQGKGDWVREEVRDSKTPSKIFFEGPKVLATFISLPYYSLSCHMW